MVVAGRVMMETELGKDERRVLVLAMAEVNSAFTTFLLFKVCE